MAEKKFAGAPFGTQTARFDVTGVHPKNKLPGSFTQMPYDKFSMVEQKTTQDVQTGKINKNDDCLHNIRNALKSAKEDMAKMEHLRKIPKSGQKKITLNNCSTRMEPSCHTKNLNGSVGSFENLNKSKNAEMPEGGDDKRESVVENDILMPLPSEDLGEVSVKRSLTPGSRERMSVILDKVSASLGNASIDSKDDLPGEDGRLTRPKVLKSVDQEEGVISCPAPPNSVDHGPTERHSIRATCKIRNKYKMKNYILDLIMKRKLGPGAYNTTKGGFHPTNVEAKASGPGWARQLEVERLAALPHLLYKEQWEENKMLKRKLGPGSYEIKDFIQANNLKPRSSKGICENLAQRFDKGVASGTPGPGTYGIGGVPQRALEVRGQQSMSTKGLLDSGDRKRNLPSVGSHLGPGTYRHKTCTEEMLTKVTSLRGPYELYSGDRNKPISEGYLAAPKLADLGPGQYEIGSFVDELQNTHKKSHGAFGKMVQYPEVPTERLFLFSQAHCPKKKDIPGPGSYSVQEISKPQAIGSPGFLSSAKRDDKLSQKFFTRNFNPVGAGRYDIQKFHEAQDINGHTSVFKSKSGKPGLQMAKFLQERIRAKDVPVQDRMFITEPEKPALSRSVTVM